MWKCDGLYWMKKDVYEYVCVGIDFEVYEDAYDKWWMVLNGNLEIVFVLRLFRVHIVYRFDQ